MIRNCFHKKFRHRFLRCPEYSSTLERNQKAWVFKVQLAFTCSNSTIETTAKSSEIQEKLTIKAPERFQWSYSAFCLTFRLTGALFRGKLQDVGDVSEKKFKYWPIRIWEITDITLLHELHAFNIFHNFLYCFYCWKKNWKQL